MQDYEYQNTIFSDSISQPQDVIDDVIVSTVNPTTSALLDNCAALYRGQVLAALRDARSFDTGCTFDVPSVYGSYDIFSYGASVGNVLLDSGTTIVGLGDYLFTKITLHTLSVSNAGEQSAFAASPDGMTIIGHGAKANQTVWRSADGGVSWSEIALPGAGLTTAIEALVFYDRFTGHWYVVRNGTDSGTKIYIWRSTSDGASWSLRSPGDLACVDGYKLSMASDEDGNLYLNTGTDLAGALKTSSDGGATWTTVSSPSNVAIASIVEHRGIIYGLGYNTPGTDTPYAGTLLGGSWTSLGTVNFPSSLSFQRFTRFAVVVGPYLVAIAAQGSTPPDNYAIVATTDGVNWSVMSGGLATEAYTKYQTRSPGGLHFPSGTTSNYMTRANFLMW